MSLQHQGVLRDAFAEVSRFRTESYECPIARGDALFELTDALLRADGPVTSLVDLTLTAEHRRGHGAMYDALNNGSVDVPRLRQVLAGLPQPESADGRLVLAVDVTHWLRPDAPTSPDRLFCHVYGRSRRSSDQLTSLTWGGGSRVAGTSWSPSTLPNLEVKRHE
ncbi:DDE superfamily endonuclease [Streptomyces sp. Ag82_O1-15]|nr:DDE superfamily endonuclease [Streptomyces sp. Ag82_O1-15]